MTEIRYLLLQDVAHITGLGESTIRRLSKTGKFPEPDRLPGLRATRWKSDEVQEWIKQTSTRARAAVREQSGQRKPGAS